MSRRFLAVAVAAALCLVVAAPVAAADPDRPFGGTTTAMDTMIPGDAACAGQGAVARDLINGTGQFLHLGLTRLHASHCTWLNPVTGEGVYEGTITLTAANGDILVLAEHGWFRLVGWPAPTSTVTGVRWEVASGSGRFVDAAGHGTGTGGLLDLATNAGFMTLSGTISY